MQLLDSWKESLQIFKPASFKLFFLVSIKSYYDALKVWLTYWGWLTVLWSIIVFHGYFIEFIPFLTIGPTDYFERYGSYSLLFFMAISGTWISQFLSARPSIKKKNLAYFTDYWEHALYITFIGGAFLTIMYRFLRLLFNVSLSSIKEPSPLLLTAIYGAVGSYFIAMFWIMAFYILFTLDSDGSIKAEEISRFRAFKMFAYNAPFCFIMTLLLYLVWLLPLIIFLFTGQSISATSPKTLPYQLVAILYELLIVMPLFVSIATNFYTKKLHERFALYFGEKS